MLILPNVYRRLLRVPLRKCRIGNTMTLSSQPDEGVGMAMQSAKENNWGYDSLTKLDEPMYDVLKYFDMMYEGKVNGYFCQGFNPIARVPQ